jgi:hypothetical protein
LRTGYAKFDRCHKNINHFAAFMIVGKKTMAWTCAKFLVQ